jgi:hypothetical protein
MSEMEAFFSGAIEMAWRGQTSMHKPHPVQVSQSTIISTSKRVQGFEGPWVQEFIYFLQFSLEP